MSTLTMEACLNYSSFQVLLSKRLQPRIVAAFSLVVIAVVFFVGAAAFATCDSSSGGGGGGKGGDVVEVLWSFRW